MVAIRVPKMAKQTADALFFKKKKISVKLNTTVLDSASEAVRPLNLVSYTVRRGILGDKGFNAVKLGEKVTRALA